MDNISIEQIKQKNTFLIFFMQIDPCMKKDLTW